MDIQVTYTDGLACHLAYEYVKEGNIEKLWELDAMLSALALARETREGNRRIGERLVKLCSVLYSEFVLLAEYGQRIRKKEAYGHPAIAFALVAYGLEINQRETIAAYIYSVVQSLIQNAVRAVPLGQTDGQKLLLFVQPLIQQAVQKIEKADAEELGMTSPGLEIAQMRHEHLPIRLFMS
jgi:urease accessory protein